MIRWTKLRFAMVPQVTVLEPFSECMLMGGLSSCSAAILFQWDPVVFYLVHVLVWFLLDWILLGVVQVCIFSFEITTHVGILQFFKTGF